MWHEVASDKPTVCLECGQIFKLNHLVDSHAAHGHGHHH
jgi:hypothetical protein